MKIKWRLEGFRELRSTPAMLADLEQRAARIADAAGPGHGVRSEIHTGGKGRARAAVVTESFEAALAEARDRNLSRAIDTGRG